MKTDQIHEIVDNLPEMTDEDRLEMAYRLVEIVQTTHETAYKIHVDLLNSLQEFMIYTQRT